MAILGQGIDASLGKVDYSFGNQAQMAAIKMRAESQKEMADSLSNTLKQFQDNKQKRDILNDNIDYQSKQAISVSAYLKTNPDTANGQDPFSGVLSKLGDIPHMSTAKLTALNAQLTDLNSKWQPKVAEDTASKRVSTQIFGALNAEKDYNDRASAPQLYNGMGSLTPQQQEEKKAANPTPRFDLLNELLNKGVPLDKATKFVTERAQLESSRAGTTANLAQAGLYNAQTNAAGTPKKPLVNPANIRGVDKDGNPSEITIDQNTGREIGRGPLARLVLTPEEQLRLKEGELELTNIVKRQDALSAAAQGANETLSKSTKLRRLLNNENTSTGIGQDYLTSLKSFGARAGITDPKKLADQQFMESLLNEDALTETRSLLKGQGTVTEAERARVDKVAMNSSKVKGANLELLNLRDAAAQRLIGANDLNDKLSIAGVSAKTRDIAVREWYKENPLSKFAPEVGGSPTQEGLSDEALFQKYSR